MDYFEKQQQFYDNLDKNNEKEGISDEIKGLINEYLATKQSSKESNFYHDWIIWKIEKLNQFEIKNISNYLRAKIKENSWDNKLQLLELWSAVQQIDTNTLNERNEIKNWLDFTIDNATARIKILWSTKDYVLNNRYYPQITRVSENFYNVILIMKRNSNSSLRWDQKVELNFRYDWRELIFFEDRNNNNRFDRGEDWKRYRINNKKTIRIQRDNSGSLIYPSNKKIKIHLSDDEVTSYNIKNLELDLYFD